MYGLEKEKKPFEFDLEKELKKDRIKAKKRLDEIEERIHEVKKEIREGKSSKDLDDLGIILHGYTAAKKVLNKALKS